MSDNYTYFVNRYGVKHLRPVTGGYDKFQPYYAGNTATYYNSKEEFIEMEIPQNGFEELVRATDRYDQMFEQEVHDRFLRNSHPAIAEAYSKYQMLLALYR